MLFSALVMRYVSEKSTLNMKMAINKLLQVTIIKITESKDNKSIQRLDVSGLTDPGGGSCPPCPPTSYSFGFLEAIIRIHFEGLSKVKEHINSQWKAIIYFGFNSVPQST